ncbi:DNA glycosylase [Decorospora gaudefroyi]|uniref:DNA glycosylase n=1 Tax=Decorospora gaudefroyi TaxID=184978 RepID=A0A6A5KAQ6_9PLEO|nr:DNA glycosylase [Decorospora gaudefroyi]
MSLRRSARVASSSAPAISDTKVENGVVAKYEKVDNKPTAAAPKKRKTKATIKTTTTPSTESVQNTSTTTAPETDFETPVTPLPKKRKAAASTSTSTSESESPAKPPPFTPTPSAITNLLSSTTALAPTQDHPLDTLSTLHTRPTEPHTTNAPLSTPRGTHIVQAYASSSPSKPSDATPARRRKAKELVAPDVGALRSPTSNVDTLLKEAEAWLVRVDPKLRTLVEKHRCRIFSPEGLGEVVDPFTALSSGIIGQQVSGQAAASIRKKFTALFPDTHPSFPTPAQVLTKDLPTLRTAGLSQRKAEYVYGLAEKFTTGELTAQMLVSASDEELIEKLVAVRGLGRWSVEMFACFGLKRMDVFSTGDLGVQRGMAVYAGRDVNKLKNKGGKWKYMSEQEMEAMAAKFSPYRSLFMWYMWRIVDVDVSVMQKT